MISAGQVKSLALSLGFDVCGITGAGPFPEAEEALGLWVKEGRHGGMKYLEDFELRAKRFWESFPEAKSIIVVGVNYYSGSENEGAGSPTGRVARYAWGKDYHHVIKKRLGEFHERLEQWA